MSTDDEKLIEEEAPASLRSGRQLRVWIVVLTGIVLLPSFVTVTGIGRHGLKLIHPELARVTKFTSLKLHWWAPVECIGLQIDNTRPWSKQAPPLLTAQQIRTQQPLWEVAWNLGRNIDLTVMEPELNLINSKTGSNVADAIEDLSGDGKSGDATFPYRVTVCNGRVNLATASPRQADTDSEDAWVIERLVSGIQCDVSTLGSSNMLPDVSFVAMPGRGLQDPATALDSPTSRETTVHPRIAARLDDLAADFQPLELQTPEHNTDPSDLPSLEIKLGPVGDDAQRAMRFVARGLELDVLEPLIAQMVPGVRCRGLLSLQGEALMLGQSMADGLAVQAAARAADFEWRMPSWQLNERLQLSTAAVDCAIAVAKDGIIVEQLSCSCPFATVAGNGEIRLPTGQLLQSILKSAQDTDVDRASAISEAESAAAGQVNINGQLDLVAISRMLPQTLNLREGLQLTEGSVKFAVRTQANTSSGEGLQGLDWLAVAESSPIVARHGGRTIRWDAPVRLQCSGPLRLPAAELRSAKLSGDFGQIQARPLAEALEVHGRFDADRLWNHLGQFIDCPPPGIRGEVEVNAWVGQSASGDVQLRDVKVRADNLSVESSHLAIHFKQPMLKMLDGQLSVKGTGAAIRSMVAPWTDASWLAPESLVSVQLDAAPPHRLTVVGEVQRGRTASLPPGPWQNPSGLSLREAQLALDIDTDSRPGHYIIRSGQLHMPGVEAQMSGTLETAGKWMTAQLVVDADYDLAVLNRMALNDPDGNIRLTGKQSTRLTVRGTPAFWDGTGPEDAEPLDVTGQIGWDAADLYGLQFGPGDAPFRLTAGQLQTEPIRCSLNGGKLVAMVNYDLRQNHVELASGSRIEQMIVNEEVSRRWLGYVAPFLASAANVQGTVSARVNQFHYNLDRPETSMLTGHVDIHGITAKPGSSLMVLLQGLDTLRPDRRSLARDLTIPPQQVQCELRNGMISHDQLLLALSGYGLKTHGAVGIDRQVNLILEIPLEKTIDQRSGRTVSIPVQGTVSQPRIDVGQLLQNAGTQRIQSEINDQLDRGLNQFFDQLR
jgi:hypothetical protein